MNGGVRDRAPERRSTARVVELRQNVDGGPVAGGYALVYHRYSKNLGGYVEQCAPGLADKSLGDGVDVLARWQHGPDMLLGRVSAGTLRLSADDVGVRYEVDLPDTTYARDLAALLARGDVRHSSFAFRALPGGDEWGFTDQGYPLRTLRAVQLVDVAPVVTPAYTDTTSGLRSLAEHRGLDLETVARAAAANTLADLLRTADRTVIDLGPTAGGPGDSRTGAQGAAHAPLPVLQRRTALLGRRLP
jgi:uncharacterized protein